MYKRNAQGWSKHFDFIVVDLVSLQIAFVLAVALRNHGWAYATPLYRTLGFVLFLADAVVLVLRNSMHGVVFRGYFIEAKETFKNSFYVFAIALVFMFSTQSGEAYSRIILYLVFGLHFVISYSLRLLWKWFIKKRGAGKENKRSMLVVATPENAETILQRLGCDYLADFRITGLVLTEKSDQEGVCGIPIVAEMDSAADFIVREWIDSVYIDAPLTDEKVIKLMDDCAQMAVPTHYHVPNMSRNGVKRFAEKLAGTTVLTTSINYSTPIQALMKRCFDILAGLVGSLVALLVIAIVGPIIKKQSPGPILFAQERIGKNGKRFKMLKIRSMYMDAEERKKDLMSQNRVKDGMMFKLDFDPRIIGNEILPDGTKKTGIGEFIRKTSLDEFPQFFLVLSGVMSTVGCGVILGQPKKKPVFMRVSVA